MTRIPGWYGKLPTLGDFASRRLDARFVEPWDTWLAEGLAGLREADPEGWLDAYLQSPTWRFVLMPDVAAGLLDGVALADDEATRPMALDAPPAPAPQAALAGVLMPSVDRVGRYFPFTLVVALPTLPRDGAELGGLLASLHRLDDLAVDAMQDDWDIERLEDELRRLPLDLPAADRPGAAPDLHLQQLQSAQAGHSAVIRLDLRHPGDVPALVAASALQRWSDASRGLSFWLADSGEMRSVEAPDSGPQLLVAQGLPREADFARLLGPSASPSTFSDPIEPA